MLVFPRTLSRRRTTKSCKRIAGYSKVNKNGWIGVDLDGTLAHYDQWQGIDHVGKPVERMCNRVRLWLANGETVKIMTARVSGHEGDALIKVCMPIWNFCYREFDQILDVTCVKDMHMISLWDDRAVEIVANTGMTREEYTKYNAE